MDQPSAHHSGGSAAGWATGFAALVFTAIVGLGLIDKGAADGEDAPTAESTISVGPGSSVHDKDSAAPAPRYFLGVNYWALGEALAKSGLWKEAGRAHSEAVKYLKALVEEFPEEPTYKMALARDYAAVAKMLIGQGAPEKAVDYQRGTVIFFKEVVAAKSSTDAQRFELARHQRNYAEVLERSGHRSEALKEIREAAKIFNHLKAEGESLTRTLQLNLVEAARTYELHGDIAEQNKEVDEARAHFLKASDLWHDLMVIGVPEARLRHEMCQRRHTTLAGQVDVSE